MINAGYKISEMSTHHYPQWKVLIDGREVALVEVSVSKTAGRNPRTTARATIAPPFWVIPNTAIMDVHWRLSGRTWVAVANKLVVTQVSRRKPGTLEVEATDLSTAVLGEQAQFRKAGTSDPKALTAKLVQEALHGHYVAGTQAWPADATCDPDEVITGSKWDWVTAKAEEFGCEAFFDHMGRFTVRPFANIGDTNAGVLRTGNDGVVLNVESIWERPWTDVLITYRLASDRFQEWDTDRTYDKGDRVIISGSSDVDPVTIYRAKVDVGVKSKSPADPTDTNWETVTTYRRHVRGSWSRPNARTWGRTDVVFERSRSKLGTMPSQAAADTAAARLGARTPLYDQTDQVDVVPLPWIEPGDTVSVRDAQVNSERAGLVRAILVGSAGPMNIEVRHEARSL